MFPLGALHEHGELVIGEADRHDLRGGGAAGGAAALAESVDFVAGLGLGDPLVDLRLDDYATDALEGWRGRRALRQMWGRRSSATSGSML